MWVYGDDISAIQVAKTIDNDYDIRTTLTGGGGVVCLRGDRGREGFGGSAFLFFRTEPLHDKLGGCGLGVSSCFLLFLFVWGGGGFEGICYFGAEQIQSPPKELPHIFCQAFNMFKEC